MAVRKLKGRYVVEFESRGHRVFRRLPTGATKGQAEELELKLRRELIDQAVLGKPPAITLDFAVSEWLASRDPPKELESKTKLVREGLKELKLESAPISGVQQIAEELIDLWDGLAPATINRRLCVLKATCTWAWKKKRWTPTNLSPHIELLPGEVIRNRVISASEIDAIIAKAEDPETRAFIALGAYAMLRQGEVMALTKAKLEGGYIRAQSKGGPVRAIEPAGQLKPFLGAIPLTLHKRTLYGRFEAARDAAGIGDLVYHDLRRSGATILLNRGVPLEVVSHILGHKSLETTRKIYAHVLRTTVRRAIRKGFKPIKNPNEKGGPGGS